MNFLLQGGSSPEARQAHNLKVVGSNPTPAPIYAKRTPCIESYVVYEVQIKTRVASSSHESTWRLAPFLILIRNSDIILLFFDKNFILT